MRVPDRLMQSFLLSNYHSTKAQMTKLQKQIATGSKINSPSDAPAGSMRVMRLTTQLGDVATYLKNVETAQSFIDMTVTSMEGIQKEVQDLLVDLSSMNNATAGVNFEVYAEKIDMVLNTILNLANTEFDGKYLFGGTEHSIEPFGFNEDETAIEIKSSNISGVKKINISKNILQQYNITGTELFQPVLQEKGNLDSTVSVGTVQSTSTLVYDADGNEYTMNIDYTKTADNSYDLNYTIEDSEANIIHSDTHQLVFNASTGVLESVDGNPPGSVNIKLPSNKIDFDFDFTSIKESDSGTSLTHDLSQKASIFNTLLAIRDKLNSGELPDAVQTQIVDDFNKHILNTISGAGSIHERLASTQEILTNQDLELQNLLSMERDVDVARAIVDFQSLQFSLELNYKFASIMLPTSLLDYL